MKKRLLYVMACFFIVISFVSCNKEKVDPQNPPPASNIIKDAVTDVDGNVYDAVKIGDQVWMAENLRTTKYADGSSIEQGNTTSDEVAYWYYPDGKSSNKGTYGLLYNWKAAMHNASSSKANPSGVQGICPMGWHVPSDAEWTQLTDYVNSQSQYQCNSRGNNIAKALASTTGWNSSSYTCAVGNTQRTNNATGFSAVPAGLYTGFYNYFGNNAFFWSATEYNSSNAYGRYLNSDNAIVGRNDGDNRSGGSSIRCVRD